MDKIIVNGKKLVELKEQYEDCSQLEKTNDLTEYGEGMLFVLKDIFEMY